MHILRTKWTAVASPIKPGADGGRYFVVNHSNSVYASRKPITLRKDCRIPRGLKLVKRGSPTRRR